ncbi:MAG: magnesium transporter [Bacillota bacterium]
MVSATNIYLSRIIRSRVWSKDRKPLGRLMDLVVDSSGIRPKVVAIIIKTDNKYRTIDFSCVTIQKAEDQFAFICNNIKDLALPDNNSMQLVKHILDKQIVDINGRKLVRVNDVRLASVSTGLYVIAVDIGLEGLLRRLGLAAALKTSLKIFGINIQSKLILWDEVQTIASPGLDIKLATPYTKLLTLHPSDLADIIEDLDKKTQAAVFASLDEEKAADVLEELETDAQINILESLPLEKAADVLEKMPADEVADILDDLKEEKAEKLLGEMEEESSEEIKELMEYPDHAVGSIMTTDFISFSVNLSVEQTLAELRKLKPEPDAVYYLYVTDETEKLSGVVSLRDLVISEPHTELRQIMHTDVVHVQDTDNVQSLVEIISKYSMLAIPVVDEEETLVGVVIINDIVYEMLRSKRWARIK